MKCKEEQRAARALQEWEHTIIIVIYGHIYISVGFCLLGVFKIQIIHVDSAKYEDRQNTIKREILHCLHTMTSYYTISPTCDMSSSVKADIWNLFNLFKMVCLFFLSSIWAHLLFLLLLLALVLNSHFCAVSMPFTVYPCGYNFEMKKVVIVCSFRNFCHCKCNSKSWCFFVISFLTTYLKYMSRFHLHPIYLNGTNAKGS